MNPTPASSQPRLRVRLRPAAESIVRSGHPWIFDESIRDQNRPGQAGELAVIYDRNDKFLAVGLYDPDSPLRIRVVHTGKPATIDTQWWRDTLRESLAHRESIFGQNTNGARLINGESDHFPALVLDRYDQTLVLKLYSAIWFPRLAEITELIRHEFPAATLILRLSRNIAAAANSLGHSDGAILFGPPLNTPLVPFAESGIRFEADVLKGQKTGFFLDQRENRRAVESLATGGHVLNAFSFSGGFSLYAARGGALSVTDVDISPHALESSRRNFALNSDPQIAGCDHRLVQADVFDWLKAQTKPSFDLVILDPPSLAKRQADRDRALRAYARLAESGLCVAKRRAILVLCSCSAHIRSEEFFSLATDVVQQSGRKFAIIRQSQEPEDHHAAFPEAAYLKALFLQLD